MKVESVPLDALHVDPANVRTHAKRNLDTIKASLQKFGQQKPIVVGAKDVVVAGNGTLEAARALGWERIDIVRTALTGADATAFAITDNRTAELAAWDEEALDAQLFALKDDDFDLKELGWDDKDWGGDTEVEDPPVPEPPNEPVTKPGDLWILGNHRLLCADSTEGSGLKRVLNDEQPWLCVTDPPFTFGLASTMHLNNKSGGWGDLMNSAQWFAGWYRKIKELLNPDGALWSCCSWRFLPIVAKASDITDWRITSLLVWDKDWIGPGGPRGLRPCYELVALFVMPDFSIPDRGTRDIWKVPWASHKPTGHSAEKPVGLFSKIIETSGEGRIILDPFLGSGTTIIAAEQLGRRCYGLEIEPKYCDVIVQRWESFTGKKAERK